MVKNELIKYRTSLGLTQEDVAKRIGCSKGHYSMIERGKSGGTIKFWLKLQNELKLTDEELVKCLRDIFFES